MVLSPLARAQDQDPGHIAIRSILKKQQEILGLLLAQLNAPGNPTRRVG